MLQSSKTRSLGSGALGGTPMVCCCRLPVAGRSNAHFCTAAITLPCSSGTHSQKRSQRTATAAAITHPQILRLLVALHLQLSLPLSFFFAFLHKEQEATAVIVSLYTV